MFFFLIATRGYPNAIGIKLKVGRFIQFLVSCDFLSKEMWLSLVGLFHRYIEMRRDYEIL